MRQGGRLWAAGLAMLAATVAAKPVAAMEGTVFVSGARPGDLWGGGVGGAISITFFDIAAFEVEGAHQSLDAADGGILSLSGRALLAPSFGRLVPYAGLSAGVRRETAGSRSDWGTMSGVCLGAKLKLPLGLRLRAEYQWVHLPDDALLPMEKRYYGGVGLAF